MPDETTTLSSTPVPETPTASKRQVVTYALSEIAKARKEIEAHKMAIEEKKKQITTMQHGAFGFADGEVVNAEDLVQLVTDLLE